MNRVPSRPVFAVIVAVAIVGAWIGIPLLGAPAQAVVVSRPDATAGVVRGSTSAAPGVGPTFPTASPEGSGGSFAPTGPGSSPVPIPGTAHSTAVLDLALDTNLELLRAKAGIPGISASILFADGSIWQGAAGSADVAAGRAVTSDTAFPVASVSKTFTSALILSLVADGRLSLDASARTVLPTLPIDPAITIRELLDHTSGLRDFFFGVGVDKALLAKPDRVWDATRSLSFVGKPYTKPGKSFHYSNTNYLILGLIAEAVGRAPVADQLRSRFFAPLGLAHTFYQVVEAPRGPLVHAYRFTGKSPKLPPIDLTGGSRIVPFISVVTAAGAAGSIATTSGDLVHWARALYGGTLLDPAMRSAMLADIALTAKYKPNIAYGLGVQQVAVDGHLTLGHSGRYLGARVVVRWLPDEQIAIAVLTNQSRTDVNPILAKLLDVALQTQSDCMVC